MPEPTTTMDATGNGDSARQASLFDRFEAHKDKISLIAVVVVVAFAAVALERLLHDVKFTDVRNALLATGGFSIAQSLVYSALSFVALIGYDYSALRYIRRKLPLGIVAVTSFCGYAIGNTVGFTLLSGGSIRLRLYSRAGLRTDEIAQVAVFCIVAWGFGVCIVSGFGVMFKPSLLAQLTGVSTTTLIAIGVALLIAVIAFIALCAIRSELTFRNRRITVPSPSLVIGQLAISAADIGFASAALYVLLPPETRPAFAEFMTIYCVALAAGIMSHVPGGLGVFEAVLLAALGDRMGAHNLIAALVAYRMIYYILPLVTAAVVLSIFEVRHYRRRVVPRPVALGTPPLDPLAALIPDVYSALMVVGAILALLSAVVLDPGYAGLPAGWRPKQISPLLGPFLIGFAAFGLLVWSRAIANRLRGACTNIVVLSFILALSFAVFYQALIAAILCLAVLGPLLVARGEFHRRCENIFLISMPVLSGWAVVFVVLLTANLFIRHYGATTTHKTVALSVIWLSRAQVCALGGCAALAMLAAAGVMRHSQQRRPPTVLADDLDQALAINGGTSDLRPLLCWPALPSILFSRSAKSAMAYFVTGRGRVALFAPFGAAEERQDAVFDFVELCRIDRNDFIFLYLNESDLPLYLDCGLTIGRWSSEARIALQQFTLRRQADAELFATLRWGEEQGLLVRRLLPEEADRLSPHRWQSREALRPAPFSEAWGVVGASGVMAIASLLRSEHRGEAIIATAFVAPAFSNAVDQPSRLIDLLFLTVIRELKALGFVSLFFGHSYAAGPLSRVLQPFRSALDRTARESGATMTYFRLSRATVEKFAPLWEPRYAAYPKRLRALTLLAGIDSKLIPGSLPAQHPDESKPSMHQN